MRTVGKLILTFKVLEQKPRNYRNQGDIIHHFIEIIKIYSSFDSVNLYCSLSQTGNLKFLHVCIMGTRSG